MKNHSIKYLLLIISFCFFSTKLFAQIPAYPGGDPMETDSAKYIVSLKQDENKLLTSQSNISRSKKDKDPNDKTTEKVQVNKQAEENTHVTF